MALERVTAVLAIDMIGRVVDNRLIVWGTGTAADWRDIITASNAGPQLNVDLRPFTLVLSDHQPFFARGIPAILAVHRAVSRAASRDGRRELLNPDGMRRSTQLLQGVICDLANRKDRLVFVEAARGDVERNPLRKADDPKREPEAGGPG